MVARCTVISISTEFIYTSKEYGTIIIYSMGVHEGGEVL